MKVLRFHDCNKLINFFLHYIYTYHPVQMITWVLVIVQVIENISYASGFGEHSFRNHVLLLFLLCCLWFKLHNSQLTATLLICSDRNTDWHHWNTKQWSIFMNSFVKITRLHVKDMKPISQYDECKIKTIKSSCNDPVRIQCCCELNANISKLCRDAAC